MVDSSPDSDHLKLLNAIINDPAYRTPHEGSPMHMSDGLLQADDHISEPMVVDDDNGEMEAALLRELKKPEEEIADSTNPAVLSTIEYATRLVDVLTGWPVGRVKEERPRRDSHRDQQREQRQWHGNYPHHHRG